MISVNCIQPIEPAISYFLFLFIWEFSDIKLCYDNFIIFY